MNKKAILCVCVVMAIAVVITLITVSEKSNIGNPVNEKIEIDESLYNNGNVAAEGMEPINKNIVLGNILQEVKEGNERNLTGLTDIEANKLFNLKDYSGLEKKVAQYESEDEYTEIWLIKISKQEQATSIFRMFNERIESLRNEYKDNVKISEIINNEKNIIMKQQNGIAIVIISGNAAEIEKSVDTEFTK